MTTENSLTADWRAESLRLTAFLIPSANFKSDGWWATAAGNEPESRTARPSRGEQLDVGIFLDNTFTLSVQPGRIDWFLTPSQAQIENFEIALKSVGEFPGIANTFASAMNGWLKDAPAIIRLAYGAVLFQRVESKDAGYRRLSKYLPSIRIDEASQDFFYQINRPRPFLESKDLTINRLAKWSVASGQPVRVAFSVGSSAAPGPVTVYAPPDLTAFACRVELDMSTPAQRIDEIPHEQLSEIFKTLVEHGSEIASQGDIP